VERTDEVEADWMPRGDRRGTPSPSSEEIRMLTRPSLARSIPFWVLFVGSLASAAFGVLLVVSKIATMEADIKAQSATAAITVYTGQSWVVLGAALVAAGLVGLAAALFLGVLVRFVPAAEVEVVEPVVALENVAGAPAAPAAPAAEAIPATPPAADAAQAPAAPASEDTER
jgi:hypothetical protein